MAYYTVSHLLHKDIQGDEPLGAKAEDFKDSDWNYVFFGGELPKDSTVNPDQL